MAPPARASSFNAPDGGLRNPRSGSGIWRIRDGLPLPWPRCGRSGDAPRPGVCPRAESGAVEAGPWPPRGAGITAWNPTPAPGRAHAPQPLELSQLRTGANAGNPFGGCQCVFSSSCPLSVEGEFLELNLCGEDLRKRKFSKNRRRIFRRSGVLLASRRSLRRAETMEPSVNIAHSDGPRPSSPDTSGQAIIFRSTPSPRAAGRAGALIP